MVNVNYVRKRNKGNERIQFYKERRNEGTKEGKAGVMIYRYVHRYPKKLFRDFFLLIFLPKTVRKQPARRAGGGQLGNLGSPLPLTNSYRLPILFEVTR